MPARVVKPGPQPAIFGYDVAADLARHYTFSDVIYLTVCGELPDARQGTMFELALSLAVPLSVCHAPTHAAVLARTCGAAPAGMFAAGGVALTEQVTSQIEEHRPFIGWLADASGSEPPVSYLEAKPEQLSQLARIRKCCELRDLSVAALTYSITPLAAIIALFYDTGVQTPEQLISVFCTARWPSVMAEGLAAPRLGFRDYPMRIPLYKWTGDES